MSRSLARRVEAIENRRRPRRVVSNIVHLYAEESRAEAWARFSAAHAGDLRQGHRVLFVPKWRSRDEFAVHFKAQQTALLLIARNTPVQENQS